MNQKIKKHDIIKGKVTGIEPYGIFVKINNQYDGLIHISEVFGGFVKDINNYVKIGEVIYCQVLEIDEQEKKLKLSIKDINYKEKPINELVKKTRLGFLPLKEHLNVWINEKLEIYHKE